MHSQLIHSIACFIYTYINLSCTSQYMYMCLIIMLYICCMYMYMYLSVHTWHTCTCTCPFVPWSYSHFEGMSTSTQVCVCGLVVILYNNNNVDIVCRWVHYYVFHYTSLLYYSLCTHFTLYFSLFYLLCLASIVVTSLNHKMTIKEMRERERERWQLVCMHAWTYMYMYLFLFSFHVYEVLLKTGYYTIIKIFVWLTTNPLQLLCWPSPGF